MILCIRDSFQKELSWLHIEIIDVSCYYGYFIIKNIEIGDILYKTHSPIRDIAAENREAITCKRAHFKISIRHSDMRD